MTSKLPPVILFGHGRSGTTLISALMRDYLGVAFGTESQFIVSYFHRIRHFQPLDDDRNLVRLIDSLLQEKWFRKSRKFNQFQLDREQILDSVEQRTYGGVLDSIFSLFAKHMGMERWGDKTPAYLHHMDIIHQLFPDARYVHVVRDGRDVALSQQKVHFGPKNIYTAALDWRQAIRKGDAFAERLPASQYHLMRYEDLLDDPILTLSTLAEFLGSSTQSWLAPDGTACGTLSKINRGNRDKWQAAFSMNDRIAFERLACKELKQHGYDTVVDQAQERSGQCAHCYWHIESELRRWQFKDYWKDNIYKAGLRLRRAFPTTAFGSKRKI